MTYNWEAPNGVLVESCVPFYEDPWAKGGVSYLVRSYNHLFRVVWKETKRGYKRSRSAASGHSNQAA